MTKTMFYIEQLNAVKPGTPENNQKRLVSKMKNLGPAYLAVTDRQENLCRKCVLRYRKLIVCKDPAWVLTNVFWIQCKNPRDRCSLCLSYVYAFDK